MKHFISLAALAGLIPLVHSHGFVTSPTPRLPGTAFEAACGQQAYDNQEADKYGNVQGMLQVVKGQSDYNAAECDAWLCKGYKYADNKANVYSYKAGETVDFTVDIRAPHTGIANVSVVDTASNTVIGEPLIYWSVYASVSTGVAANDTKFSVTIPNDLGSQCSAGGDCVLQWYWYAQSIDQTYESCVDFTVDGSGSTTSSPSASSSSSSSSAVATTSSTTASASTTSESAPVEASSTSAQPSVAAETSATAGISAPSVTAVQYTTTTFATKARATKAPATVPDTPSTVASTVPIPTDGNAQEMLGWISDLAKYLVGDN
ncbi:chitin binding protein [Penicillium hispanicum]|uniref:chitin binding protein n=1 Tax=Penicillium hispanicum TaxID=1080232 RepID=UPI00253F7C4A|nr:chitin binding protein [Penicillium hispanicum]KAJ5578440.1 chitin binding protein [Penicillium hispanicum]